MRLFFIPGSYLYYSRLGSIVLAASLFIIFIFPISGLCFTSSHLTLSVFFISLLIAWIAFYAIYEIGYLRNDVFTVRREETPNNRIASKDQDFFQSFVGKLTVVRVLWAIAGLSILLFILPHKAVFQFSLFLILTLSFFMLHNTVRSKKNILTYFCLNISKIATIPALFLDWQELWTYLPYLIIIFSLLRTLEHASKPKYGIKKLSRLWNRLDSFRVLYFSILLILLLLLKTSQIWIILTVYFLLYRIASFWGVKKLSVKKLKLKR